MSGNPNEWELFVSNGIAKCSYVVIIIYRDALISITTIGKCTIYLNAYLKLWCSNYSAQNKYDNNFNVQYIQEYLNALFEYPIFLWVYKCLSTAFYISKKDKATRPCC